MKTTLILLILLAHLMRAEIAAILNNGVNFDGVQTSPRFLSHGGTFRVVIGGAVSLPCEVQNLGANHIVWRKGPIILAAVKQMLTKDARLALSGNNLTVNDIQHADQGDYTCQIGDGSMGDLIHTLEILMSPTIQIIPPNGQVTTRKGGPVSFECRANGNPQPHIQWAKKDGLLPSGVQVQNGYLLSLNDVQRQHAGVYQCTASNGVGQPVTSEINLTVLYPPEVNVLKSWSNTNEGVEAKLECIVHADPPAEVSWYQNSFQLQPTDRRLFSHHSHTHTLTIRNLHVSDFGNYSCVVANSIGREKKFIVLSGKPGAPIVTSPPYSNPHDYNLTWSVQSVFDILEVRILYRLIQINTTYRHSVQWHDLLVRPRQYYNPLTSERHQSYHLANLQPDSVYECLIQTKNQHGFGDLSDTHQWFTSQKGRIVVRSTATAINAPSVLLIITTLTLMLLRHTLTSHNRND